MQLYEEDVALFHIILILITGMQARIMYQMPATAICWSTYEFFKYLIASSNDVRLVPGSTSVAAIEEEKTKIDTSNTFGVQTHQEKYNLKSRELPAMSGAGLYGSISFNTIHKADKESRLEIIHT